RDRTRSAARGRDRAARFACSRMPRLMLGRDAVLTSMLLLGSCAGMNDWIEGKTDYGKASTVPPLEIPPDLTSPTRDNRYVVPETGTSTATLSGYQAERRDAKPGGVGPVVLPQPEHMRIERSGTQRWLVVDERPEKLWPLVKDFWQENGFLLKVEQPEIGVLETEWAESRARIPQGMGIRGLFSKAFDTLY